jgi:cytochrome c peroxidase
MNLSAQPSRQLDPETRVKLFRTLDFLQRVGLLVIITGFLLLFIAGLLIATRGVPNRLQTLTIPRTPSTELTAALVRVLDDQAIAPLVAPPVDNQALVILGKSLFFETALSGNRDLSCATCHHPLLNTTDNSPLAVGPNGFAGVNVPSLFGLESAETLHWDGAISFTDGFSTPANGKLPAEIDTLLAAQALIHLAERDIMRGNNSELATLDDSDYTAIWAGVVARLLALPDYQAQFAAAYPEDPVISPAHIGNALAAYQMAAFSTYHSDWDRFVLGDRDALSDAEKRGAILFFGEANCASCHAGASFSDWNFHNIAVPQIGDEVDFGRYNVTEDPRDYFRFRTPPLRNVALTAPYMHSGTYQTLAEAVRHHLDAQDMLNSYDPSQLPDALATSLKTDSYTYRMMARTLSDYAANPPQLTGAEFNDLLAFLNSLTNLDRGPLLRVIR